ncbi:TRAP transporter small permease [Salipaludibacillus agaradhaerens]|uniref:TRAP transporter small permease n=1 Tax=Salipaludibacillus agaradhaerens TaxID=76935 RepID=A0A9Q4B1E5_SALAG|nr:TRAP transporter small permease [Salipaludibacillus agaradhaerens]UJW57950.1 TRAP transporter small permease [Bacillus sp. A116_S68]MCR6096252.1 TRAP transporter small permease [Salipaludibacillus agaradhaerens]MCR6106844.1 TRAP transporter small permease [Salipaludibacillus agaradhaerens]MCR6114189.1 TRAP transporter small permease [Salipaludibacillus agaradhaerens]MCR6118876.1 TRAP transporter small permease [Salipaludibacillus agaradhaerens]
MFQRLDDLFAKSEKIIISYSIIMMTVILLGNVLSRTIFNSSWAFAEELAQFFVLIVTFIGLSYAARHGRHLSMTALLEWMPYNSRKIVMSVITVTTAILMGYLTYLSFLFMFTVADLQRVTPALRIPMYFLVAVMPIGFFLTSIQYVRTFLRNVRKHSIHEGTEKIMNKEGGQS